ncbi:MAG: daunorubicin resistance protein DrrA family ABC transporter ATP-binding protein [Chloroflexota bacterium]
MTVDTGPEIAISAQRLHRVYHSGRRFSRNRKRIVAVEDISFTVPTGTIFGMLGPNGAGKTTTIKMLSTLLIPSSGTATVGGHDVVREERLVRRLLGVVLGGDRGLYAKLSARDNLSYFGSLYGMRRTIIARRVEEMLELVNLRDRGGERVEGFSRGMKQRLHLAKALLHDPPVLILDEPTIGLDPAAAVDLRHAIGALVPGHTVLLTTHDMSEADALCREIAIVDKGLIVAQGTPAELKSRVAGHRRIVVSTRNSVDGYGGEIETRLSVLPEVRGVSRAVNDGHSIDWTLLCADTAATLDETLAILRGYRVPVETVRVIEPTLEDAFLAIAGRSFE